MPRLRRRRRLTERKAERVTVGLAVFTAGSLGTLIAAELLRMARRRRESRETATPATLSVRVRDDGVGLPAKWTFERDAGVGLRNVAARLEHIYGRPELLRVVPVATGGVEVQIDVPREPPDLTRQDAHQ